VTARRSTRAGCGASDGKAWTDRRQYLQAGLIDELHLALSPVLLGRGEAIFEGLDLPVLGYRVMESIATDLATHVVLGREESE
jgi:dihydrofolate reductase